MAWGWTESGPRRCEMISYRELVCRVVLVVLGFGPAGSVHAQRVRLPAPTTLWRCISFYWRISSASSATLLPSNDKPA
jgi:hypothetical protein